MRNKRVLVTGEGGFIGSNMADEIAMDVYRAHDGADAFVLMTAHRKFRELDLRRVKEHMRTPIIIDGRRVFEQEEAVGLGFTYRGVGAGNKNEEKP